MYLKREKNIFLKSINEQDCFHPQTVVFDSPGCKDMLSHMIDKLDVWLDGHSIDIEHLISPVICLLQIALILVTNM